jgi:hypothetical protein
MVMTACGGGPSATTTSVAEGPFASQAEQVINDLAASNFQAVWGMFDASLQGQLSVARLANGWAVYQLEFGHYRSHGTPELIPLGSLDVEQLPMVMVHGTEEARVTFEPNGSIAGLVLLKAGAPPPTAS